MQPKITTAEHQLSFKLSSDYTGSVYTEVESTGLMQFLHFLVIHGSNKQPLYFFCAEWFDADTLANYGPTLGAFSSMGHENHGDDKNWADLDLFVLTAIEMARQQLGIRDMEVNEGEAWALTHILNKVQCLNERDTPKHLSDGYLKAMSNNDARLLAYLQTFNVH